MATLHQFRLLVVLILASIAPIDAFQPAFSRRRHTTRRSLPLRSSTAPPLRAADLALSIPSLLVLNKPSPTSQVTSEGLAKDILETQDAIGSEDGLVLREALKVKRYLLLCCLLKESEEAYYRVASFLAESEVYDFERWDAPNVQEFGLLRKKSGERDSYYSEYSPPPRTNVREITRVVDDLTLTKDSNLSKRNDKMSALDGVLLTIFRKVVGEETKSGTGTTPGMEGLVEQGRNFMIKTNEESHSSSPSTADERQIQMVRSTLRRLMGPIKPIYRLFMGGIVPAKVAATLQKEDWKNKQVFEGGLFYAPFLTSLVTPLFFQWLVGPARTCRRKDGTRGGVVVEKCRFLEISNCKGLCLNICKKPAEEFFKEELGVGLYVQPNFATHECHWNWGVEPPEGGVKEDESWPKGCMEGCMDRKKVAAVVARQERENDNDDNTETI